MSEKTDAEIRNFAFGNRKRTLSVIAVLILVSTIFFSIVKSSYAATGRIYLSPGSANLQVGSSQTISIRMSTGVDLTGVEANVTYDASKLEYVSIDTSASAFDTRLLQTISSGSVKLVRGSISGAVNGDVLIANLTFKALAGSGSSTLAVSGRGSVSGTYTDPTTSGTTINFSTPQAPPPPNTGGGGSTTTPGTGGGGTAKPSTPSAPSTPSTPSPTPENPSIAPEEPAAPKPTYNAKASSQITYGVLQIATDKPTTVALRYGDSPDKLLIQATSSEPKTTHELRLDSLGPATTYYYQVVATDTEGNVTEGQIESFATRGFKVRIVVMGRENKPISNKKITLHSDPQTGKTDGDGVVVFENVSAGDHEVVYEQDGKELSIPIHVVNDIVVAADGSEVAGQQNFSIAYDVTPRSLTTPLVLLTLFAISAVFWVMWRRRNNKSLLPSFASTRLRDVQESSHLPETPPAQQITPSSMPQQVIHPTNPNDKKDL